MSSLAAVPRRFAPLSAAHVTQLEREGYAIVDDFVDAAWAGELRAELLGLHEQGLLQPNQIQLATSKGPVSAPPTYSEMLSFFGACWRNPQNARSAYYQSKSPIGNGSWWHGACCFVFIDLGVL